MFSFLNAQKSLRRELKIFSSQPVLPFLRALYRHALKANHLRYLGAFLIAVIYLCLAHFSFQLATYFSYSLLIIGLLWIGIPHGALDHMLSKNKSNSLVLFVFKYLLIIAIYYIFWQFFPLIGLVVFIIYSSFHFGESELAQTDGQVETSGAYLKSFLMGLSILLFIILSHPDESMRILANFIEIPLLSFLESSFTSLAMSVAVLSYVYILLQSIMSKRWPYFGLLFLLALGVKVPLILAFGFYFILQHSANAWQHLKVGLNMNSMQLFKKSSFYTLGALVIFLLIAYNANEIASMAGFWANFFIFISCISFPHFFLMHVFYKSRTHSNTSQ